jgi:hypothetical protein
MAYGAARRGNSETMGPKARAAAAALLVSSIAIALIRALAAPGGPAPRLKGPARERVADTLADKEPENWRKARLEFPGDYWSQSDAFGALEQDAVRDAARAEKVSISSVLEVLDHDLHTHRLPNRLVSAAPCKPRPFYD